MGNARNIGSAYLAIVSFKAQYREMPDDPIIGTAGRDEKMAATAIGRFCCKSLFGGTNEIS